jgi:hypothetical protein
MGGRTRWAACSTSCPACCFAALFERTAERRRSLHSTAATPGVRRRWTHLHHDLRRFIRPPPTLHVVVPSAHMGSPLQQAALSLRRQRPQQAHHMQHPAAIPLPSTRCPPAMPGQRCLRCLLRLPNLNLQVTSTSATPGQLTPCLCPPLHRPPPRRRWLQTRTTSALM